MHRFLLVRVLIASLVALLVPLSAPVAAYDLRPGDRVTLTYLGLPAATATATINTDGSARFPLIGSIEAAGLTIEAFQQVAERASIGRRFSTRGDDGLYITIELEGYQIFADVANYAPIYIIGDVLRPGEISYRPGMSVRGALAKAGGASIIPNAIDPVRKIFSEEVTNQRLLAHEYAQAAANLWRVDALLAFDSNFPQPDLTGVIATGTAFEATMKLQRLQFFAELDAYNVRRASLITNIESIDEISEIVSRQIEENEQLVEADRENLQQIKELSNRGLTANERVQNAQRSFALSANQLVALLRTQSETQVEEAELRARLTEIEKSFTEELVNQRNKLQAELDRIEIRLRGSWEILGANDFADLDLNSPPTTQLQLTGVRVEDGKTIERTFILDEPVLPGDVIEVGMQGARLEPPSE